MNINLDSFCLEEIKCGYCYDVKTMSYTCNVCGEVFGEDEVYSFDNRFFKASRAIKIHIEREHNNRLEQLLCFESKYVMFTENQKQLLMLINSGLSDSEIAKKLGISPSTVRHQKFTFREKAKQAKMWLSIYELATENKFHKNDAILPVHANAKMVDDRYNTTIKERDKILETAFESLSPLKLKVFSAKEKKKIVILTKIAEQFKHEKRYSEIEVNQTLKEIFEDYATIRRYLIEYGFMDRTTDCKQYWLK